MVKKKIIVFVLLLIHATHLFCEKCGKEGIKKNRISGGHQSEPHQYPWMVTYSYFQNGTEYWCAGSLISNKHILTSKHCSKEIDRWGTSRVGAYNFSLESNDNFVVEFNKVFLHDTEDDNDIAIIMLKEPVDLEDPTIGTICLPETEKKEYIGEPVKAMGWGMVDINEWFELLKVVDLEVAKKQEKYFLYTNVPKIKGVYQDPCAGDSGGPLAFKTGDQWTIIGTVFGNGYDCRDGTVYGLGKWNKVTAHLKWIKMVINNFKKDVNEIKESGFHDQGLLLIHPHEHWGGNMGNNNRNENVGSNKQNTYGENSHSKIYGDNNEKNIHFNNNFIKEKFDKNNGFAFIGTLPVNRYRGNSKTNVLPKYNKENVYVTNYRTKGYGDNNDINEHIRKNHGNSNNKENAYMGDYHVNRYAGNNHINGHMRKTNENSYNKEYAYVGNYQVNGYTGNNHAKGHIKKKNENSKNKENAYAANYHANGYTVNIPIKWHIKKNHKNIDDNGNAYMGDYKVNRYEGNTTINGQIKKKPKTIDNRGNANVDNKMKIDIWINPI